MPFADVSQGGRIHYTASGTGAPVLLVAGIGGAAGYWKPQVDTFSARFELVLHDHRGTGQSSRDHVAYSVGLMTDDMIGVMDTLGIESAHVVGHSTGAVMAQDMALRYPDRIRSAVMYAGWARRDGYFQRCFDVRKRVLLDSGPLAYVRTTPLFLMPPWYVSRNIDRLAAEEPAAAAAFPPAEIMASRIDAICAWDPGDALRAIRCPALVACARDDQLTPAFYSEEVARLVPRARLHLFETGGHAVSQTLPEVFDACVIPYIEGVEAEWQAAHGAGRA
jgi:aminoacrylate hydrolase